jgi:hypothetical protein
MFHGAIDEARLYNRALSAAEVQALMSDPQLSIAQSGASVVLSWPAAALDFVLESSDSLSPANWTTVTESIVVDGTRNTVTLPIGSASQFYRLKQ